MGPLTEGKTLHAKKKRHNVRPKTSPPAPKRKKNTKKEINHNKGLHTQVSLCNIMLVSLLFGGAGIFVSSTFDFLGIVYMVSIAVSFGAMHLLPKFKSINITHVRNMKYDAFVLWFILFLGPIMTIFTITTLLLPPKKKKEEVPNETK